MRQDFRSIQPCNSLWKMRPLLPRPLPRNQGACLSLRGVRFLRGLRLPLPLYRLDPLAAEGRLEAEDRLPRVEGDLQQEDEAL